MKIAIGSTRIPKVEAVKEAWEAIGSRVKGYDREPATFLAYDVGKETPEMPVRLDQLMEGARSRVENLILQLKRERQEADFYVGLEGGFQVIDTDGPRRQTFLESWAYATDGHNGYFGHGPGLYVPNTIANPIIDRGIEMGIVMDRLGGQQCSTKAEGIWGMLTGSILTRQQSFVIAVICAFVPFCEPEMYRR
ncbi:MAG TPA: inosine/xanthosine triphosphatase [Acidobacteriota bacterium]|nr:inosine/xanthosine triphosphatase [Acidobacteriota bacterium]